MLKTAASSVSAQFHDVLFMLISNTFALFADNRECESNPCQNNGVCVEGTAGLYNCTCESEYFGINCEYSAGKCVLLLLKMQSITAIFTELLFSAQLPYQYEVFFSIEGSVDALGAESDFRVEVQNFFDNTAFVAQPFKPIIIQPLDIRLVFIRTFLSHFPSYCDNF